MPARAYFADPKEWIDDRLADLASGTTLNPEKTFAHYWIKNAGNGENFAHQDVVFEVFHNFCPGEQLTIQVFEDFLRQVLGRAGSSSRNWTLPIRNRFRSA